MLFEGSEMCLLPSGYVLICGGYHNNTYNSSAVKNTFIFNPLNNKVTDC